MNMLEKVRRAIKRCEMSGLDPARAAIEALREPDEAMLDAGFKALEHHFGADGFEPGFEGEAMEAAFTAMISTILNTDTGEG